MKPTTASIPFKLNLNLASNFLIQRGFYIHEHNDTELHMFKPGTAFTVSLKRVPIEISLRISDNQTDISLSYGTYVLFETGDLSKELTRIIDQLERFKEQLV